MAQHEPKILIEDTQDQAVHLACDLSKAVVCEAVGESGGCTLALSGGTTPQPLYRALAEEAPQGQVPWSRVEVFFGDERDVPLDHVESNFRMAQRALMDHLPFTPQKVHPMRSDAVDLDQAAAEYERTIRDLVPAGPDGLPRFSLILLGMGGDGHTASLFASTDALDESDRLVTACFVPVLGRNRMTMTFPLINAARNIIMLVTGPDKAEAVARILSDDPAGRAELPAGRVCLTDGVLTLVLDAAAGRYVTQRQRS